MKAKKDRPGTEVRQIERLRHSLLTRLQYIQWLVTHAEDNLSTPERVSGDLECISAEAHLIRLDIQLAQFLSCLERGNIPYRSQTLSGQEIRRLVVHSLTNYHLSTVNYHLTPGNSRGIDYEVHDGGHILTGFRCELDKDMLIHLLAEVIGNAFKFSRAGSIVRARFSLSRLTHLRIAIENEGMVLRAKEVKRVTERGWRSREAELCTTEGSGLGLWVASIIAETIGAHLTVRPTDPTGITSVEVSIPPSTTK